MWKLAREIIAVDPQSLIASLLAHTHEGIVITDAEAVIVEVNTAFSELTGYSREEVLGRNPRFMQAGHHPPAYYAKLWRILLEQGCWQGELLHFPRIECREHRIQDGAETRRR